MRIVDLLYSGGYRWWGVSVVCSSIELMPTVIRPTVQWWIQIVGVSVVCSSIELVPTVIFKTYCTVADTDSVVSVSPVPL